MIKGRTYSWIWLLGLAISVPCKTAWAQAQNSSLAVRVTNKATGQPIQKALCVIKSSLDTGFSTYHLTDGRGVCQFPVLRPGLYALRVDGKGFKPEDVPRVVVGSSGTEVKVTMQPIKSSVPAAIECQKKLEEVDI